MASDLISRSALLKAIEESKPLNWTDSESEIQADFDYKCFADMVKNQPTAYNVDAVVEQIEEMFGVDPMYYGAEARWAVDKAIEIVKAGETDG